LNQFGHNVCKSRLANSVTPSFNSTMEQITEMSHRKNKTRLGMTSPSHNKRRIVPGNTWLILSVDGSWGNTVV